MSGNNEKMSLGSNTQNSVDKDFKVNRKCGLPGSLG
jgi:hypothetical protein